MKLNIRNTFNSTRRCDCSRRWKIAFTLQSTFCGIDGLLCLVYEIDTRQRKMRATTKPSQVSVLGPDFWNTWCKSLLWLKVVGGPLLVGYSDDLVALGIVRAMERAQLMDVVAIPFSSVDRGSTLPSLVGGMMPSTSSSRRVWRYTQSIFQGKRERIWDTAGYLRLHAPTL